MTAGWRECLALILMALAGAAILAWRWVGFQGTDDANYAQGALQWLTDFPPVAPHHWGLRHPLVVPMAGFVAVLGRGATWLGLVNLLYYLAFLVFHYAMLRRFLGVRAGLIGLAIALVLPVLPVQATYANPDLPEMCAIIAAFWLLLLAREGGGARTGLLLGAGALAGLGFLLRETTVSLVLTIGLLFVLRPAMPRLRYLWIGGAFAALVGMQSAYLGALTGDPLYRFRISVHHDAVDRASAAAEARAGGLGLDKEGVLTTAPWAAPFAAVLVSQKYGLVFHLGLAALAWVGLGRFAARPRRVGLLFGLLAGVSFGFVALAGGILYVVPRYFIVPAVALSVPLALAADRLLAWRPRLGAVALAGFLASCVGLLWLENVEPLWAERQIVAVARAGSEPVFTNPGTAQKARNFDVLETGWTRISGAPPPRGALLAYLPEVAAACASRPGCAWRPGLELYEPTGDVEELSRAVAPRRALFTLLGRLGLASLVPRDIWRKLEKPNSDVVFYRLK